MRYVTVKPILGLRNNTPPDGPEMYKALDQHGEILATYIAAGQNIDLARERNAINKAYGYSEWSHSAVADASLCMGLQEIYDGTNRDLIIFDHGKVYIYNGSKDPVEKAAEAAVTFATGAGDMYSIIQFGGYAIWADFAEHTPYKWSHGDTYITKLITGSGATEYQFKYLIHLANRIVGAWNGTDDAGDLSVRWTSALPAWADLEFTDADQLYKPEGDESITGMARLGNDFGFVFSNNDITRIEYYPSHAPIFRMVCAIKGVGTTSHHSIISDGSNLYFFDANRGFIQYNGATGYNVISEPIEDIIDGISIGYSSLIHGKSIPGPTGNRLIWSIPAAGSATPNKIIEYDPRTQQWTGLGTEVSRSMDYWLLPSATERSWVFANTDGKLYEKTGEDANGSAWDGYFITPVVPNVKPALKKRILEIWLSINNRFAASTYIHVYHRGGDTVGELENQSWTELGTVDMKDSAKPVVYCDVCERLNQFKIETNAKDEYFSITEMRIGYIAQGGN